MGEALRPMRRQFEASDIIDLTDADALAKLRWERDICSHIADVLQKHYPGYMWSVQCDVYIEREDRRGVVTRHPGAVMISLPAIMPPNKVYVIPIGVLNTENDFQRLAMRAGGELLEMFGLKRRGIIFSDFEAVRPLLRLDHKAKLPN